MDYHGIVAAVLNWYVAGCGIAFFLGRKDRAQMLQSGWYAAIISGFYVVFVTLTHGPAFWHFYWYLVNATADLGIVLIAGVIKARSSKPVMWLGIAATLMDLVYFGFAASGHRLPGLYYFTCSNTLEGLQVASMIVFSGPVMPAVRRITSWCVAQLKRMFQWTPHKLASLD